MTLLTFPPPCATRFKTNKTSHEDRIKEEGDLPSEKFISKNALLAMISAIFTAVILVQEERVLIFRFLFVFTLITFMKTSQLLLLLDQNNIVSACTYIN